jgi:serine/threonine protein kinase
VNDQVPERIEGYRIESELARGGMGVVYLAHQDFPDRRVALKLLSPDLAADPDFRERFIRESNAAASTEHPNIVPIYGAGEAEGRLYLAMRYIEGTDLGALIRRDGPLPPDRAVDICAQVAAALDAAHGRGLVHRDVKPGNILVDAAGNAYLHRLRLDHPDGGRYGDHPDRTVHGFDRVLRAGADQRRGGRAPDRRVFARVCAVRVPDRRAAVPWTR